MRFPAWIPPAALALLAACSSTAPGDRRFAEPNELMAKEIENRIDEIALQHREELFNNLVWLAQAGEQAIPALLRALHNPEPKVRSNAIWVLGQIGDRRVVQDLKPLVKDSSETVRLEASRTLLALGDVSQAPAMIAALDSDKVQVRYLCHEALKEATGHDFGYDHLTTDLAHRRRTVLSWRKWWGEMSGDPSFAATYAKEYGLPMNGEGAMGQVAAPPTPPMPMTETAAPDEPQSDPASSTKTPNTPAVAPSTTDPSMQPSPMTSRTPDGEDDGVQAHPSPDSHATIELFGSQPTSTSTSPSMRSNAGTRPQSAPPR